MGKKTHYKMYKAGKNWIFAMLTTVALTGVMAMSGNTAKADTVAQSTTEQVAKIDTTSAATTSTQVEKAINTTNESNATQTSATTTTEQRRLNIDATSSSQNTKQATMTSVATSQNTSVANKDQASSTQSSTTQKSEESKVEIPVDTANNASQKNVNSNWYLVDNNTGKNLTGFQEIKDQNKVVYYAPSNAQMQYGWQNINSNKYYFDKFSGAMTTGQKHIDGSWYLFDNQGVMQTGFQKIADQNKTVHYDSDGKMQFGWQWVDNATRYFDTVTGAMTTGQKNINNHWYLFDNKGAMQRGFQNLKAYGQDKTVYYNKDGWMLYGQQNIGGYWYNFDRVTGKMSVGFTYLTDQNKKVYYSESKDTLGQMQYGWQKINNNEYYFDTVTGTIATGQKNIGGHWYNFDKVTSKMSVGFTHLTDQNKTVYYSEDKAKLGQMLYGSQVINGRNYYFDIVTGAVKRNELIFNKVNHTLAYVTREGVLAKNMKYKINNVEYAFNVAGVLEHLGGEANIAGNWYLFDNNNHVLIGFQTLKDGRKVYYSPNNAQMQYGQQNIDGHWYLFDKVNGAMKTDFQNLAPYGQNKTVYYGSNGQMQYGVFRIGKITYTADHMSGAIIGVYNDAEVIGQNPELPTGCEITAVTMMLRYAGANVNKIQLANEMPRSNNGDYGFVGNPFSVTGWWVFPTGVAPVVNKHLGHSQVMTGASLESIKNKLLNGHLVVAWVANMNGFVNHAIALTGYNGNTLYYNNPWTARKESMSVSSFYTHWNADKQRALSY